MRMNTKVGYRLLFHGFITFVYFCAIIRHEYLPQYPKRFGGRFQFLTYWNLLAHFAFFALSCVVDFTKSSSSNYNKLIRLRDKLYAGIALPYGVLVCAVFWILYAINRELIFPKALDSFFPRWLNHVCHTLIVPAILIETYIIKHRHPRKEAMTLTVVFGVTYTVWILFLGFFLNIWVYPVLQILSWYMRLIFVAVCVMSVIFLYYVGEKLNCCFWGESVVQKNK